MAMLTPIFLQFAYNETSFFLVRLLQQFSSVSLATDVQTLPPAEWAKCSGRKAIEKVIIKSHLTIYAHVRPRLRSLSSGLRRV